MQAPSCLIQHRLTVLQHNLNRMTDTEIHKTYSFSRSFCSDIRNAHLDNAISIFFNSGSNWTATESYRRNTKSNWTTHFHLNQNIRRSDSNQQRCFGGCHSTRARKPCFFNEKPVGSHGSGARWHKWLLAKILWWMNKEKFLNHGIEKLRVQAFRLHRYGTFNVLRHFFTLC
jgi:hypothetical protein